MKKILFLVLFLLIVCGPVFADVQIGEFVIDDESSAEDVIRYIFQILVSIGALIAVGMVILGGIEWMTSDGNPGKIGPAKLKIKNALLGVIVLLGSYLIIDTINPDIKNTTIEELTCEYGIAVEAQEEEDGPILSKCIDKNMIEIGYDIKDTVSWNFPEGSIRKVYAYDFKNYLGGRQTFDFTDNNYNTVVSSYSGDISGKKSIYFLMNRPGVYLYDNTDYKLGVRDSAVTEVSIYLHGYDEVIESATEPFPAYTNSSISDLSSHNFNNKTQSIELVQEGLEDYRIVAFEKQNYEGRCSLISESIEDLNNDAVDRWQYSESIGRDTISSLVVKKDTEIEGGDKGYVVFYTTKNCNKPIAGESTGVSATEIKKCELKITGTPSHENITDKCDGWTEDDAVLSFEIIGKAGIVLSTSKQGESDENTECKYFDTSTLGGGTCFSDISGTSVYEHYDRGKKPRSFIIISNE